MTALRWGALLESLGHDVATLESWQDAPCDVLIALHARKSFPSVERFARGRPDAPIVVALTGTDLYADLPDSVEAQQSLALAARLVALQPKASEVLPPGAREKVRVIYQSVPPIPAPPDGRPPGFDVCVLSHLRAVKDPLRTAAAARLLPDESRLRVLHVGRALEPTFEDQACAEQAANSRYRWLGELPREKAWEILAGCRLLALTSLMEGGANVISEAVVASVPVVSSRIAGSLGLLGDDYPGYFPVGDEAALAELLWRAERDRGYYADLATRCAALRPLFDPARERESWRALLNEL